MQTKTTLFDLSDLDTDGHCQTLTVQMHHGGDNGELHTRSLLLSRWQTQSFRKGWLREVIMRCGFGNEWVAEFDGDTYCKPVRVKRLGGRYGYLLIEQVSGYSI